MEQEPAPLQTPAVLTGHETYSVIFCQQILLSSVTEFQHIVRKVLFVLAP
jgi:hypothetical protein